MKFVLLGASGTQGHIHTHAQMAWRNSSVHRIIIASIISIAHRSTVIEIDFYFLSYSILGDPVCQLEAGLKRRHL